MKINRSQDEPATADYNRDSRFIPEKYKATDRSETCSIVVPREALLDALTAVMRAVSAHNPLPILSGILIRHDASGLSFTASNFRLIIRYFLLQDSPVGTAIYGQAVVPAKLLHDMTKKLPPGPIRLELDEASSCVRLQAGHARFRLRGMDPSDFPPLPDIGPTTVLSMRCDQLNKAITQVAFAASASGQRPVLTGIACRLIDENRLQLLASDGVRLGCTSIHAALSSGARDDDDQLLLLPAANMVDIAKLLAGGTEEAVSLSVGRNHVLFRTNRWAAYSVRMEGSYPASTRLIPEAHTTSVLADTSAFAAAIERLELLGREGGHIELHATAQSMQLKSAASELGDGDEELTAANMEGEPLRIFFRGRFIRDILRAIESPAVTLRFTGSTGPITIVPQDDPSTIYLLTPLRA
ncbi:DNA polymerase-3 subunit beta [Paenibacillus phyllosphaerae]|uniref:Beta sliding clamp n=1 Tax=Paenibacillus phyllosphaerae TaxID=274593 RepID=A0A7W5B551_9BACL|nr:DNA polymerase III subunit beta [Paenibacillus phyllosphaerae]MBB3114592.1 DNA polymerase-3 subunit beta [Paenibacillus phyllosphaerae]